MSTKHPRPVRFPVTAESFAVSWPFRATRWGLRGLGAVVIGLSALGSLVESTGGRVPALLGCSRSAPPSESDDIPRLANLLAADGKVDGLLSEADRLDRQGKSAEAAKLVEGEATTALNDARALVRLTTVETSWAKEHRDQIEKLFADRAASMPTYAASLRGSDPMLKIEALVAQATLEKRALGIAASIRKKQSPP